MINLMPMGVFGKRRGKYKIIQGGVNGLEFFQ
jgi:hypothetical protein